MSVHPTPQHLSRVRAIVEFITWAPSQGGQINTTEKQGGIVKVWVHHPLDDRYPPAKRGGEEAVAIVKSYLQKNSAEWLGLISLHVDLEDKEALIVNQPPDTLGDLGLAPVDHLPEPGHRSSQSLSGIQLVDR